MKVKKVCQRFRRRTWQEWGPGSRGRMELQEGEVGERALGICEGRQGVARIAYMTVAPPVPPGH